MKPVTQCAERRLDVLNVVLSDVRYGLGSYLAVYLLAEHNWDEATIGFVLSLGGLAGLVAQLPLAALLDIVHSKRAVLGTAVAIVTSSILVIPVAPRFWPVVIAGIVGSVAGVVMAPALAAISLGIVGVADFARRAGRNEALFHAGNAACNVVIMTAAPYFGSQILFWLLGVTGIVSIAATMAIPGRAINHDLARGIARGTLPLVASSIVWQTLISSRPLKIFAACGALFHMANAAMLPLLGQKLALLRTGHGIAFTAACAITAQVVMVPTALFAGRHANAWGRKPLFLTAFLALVLRGVLYTVSDEPGWLVSVQVLDGLGAGLIGALVPVVVADVTYGTGHFNAAHGAVVTIHSMGAICSTTLAGQIVVRSGYDLAFLTLSGIAASGAALYWLYMPETRTTARDLAASI